MTARPQALRLTTLAILLLTGIGPCLAQGDAFDEPPPHRVRVLRRVPRSLPPAPPPALVSGYLPRNNAVPMYNEPPAFRAPGYYGR